jgi:hypothetical protein
MESPKKKRATYQDVLDAPEHKIAEIIDGELRLSPRPVDRQRPLLRRSIPRSAFLSAAGEAGPAVG